MVVNRNALKLSSTFAAASLAVSLGVLEQDKSLGDKQFDQPMVYSMDSVELADMPETQPSAKPDNMTAQDAQAQSQDEEQVSVGCDDKARLPSSDDYQSVYPEIDSSDPTLACLAEIGKVCLQADADNTICVDFERSDLYYKDKQLHGRAYMVIDDEQGSDQEFYAWTLDVDPKTCRTAFNQTVELAEQQLESHPATRGLQLGYEGLTTNCLNNQRRAQILGVEIELLDSIKPSIDD